MSLSTMLKSVFHKLLSMDVGCENEVLILHTLFWIINEIAERHEIDVVYCFRRNEEIWDTEFGMIVYSLLNIFEVLHNDRSINTITVFDDEAWWIIFKGHYWVLLSRYKSVDLVADVLINKGFDHAKVLWRVDPFVEWRIVDEREVLTVNERHCCCIHIKCVKNVVWFEGERMGWIFEGSRGFRTRRAVWR